MRSGIYKFTFESGFYYIGKSNDIDRRWDEHMSKFVKGTAAQRIQAQYDVCGSPDFEVILYCHEDHIDLMEDIYIEENWMDGFLLNTTRPKRNSYHETRILTDNIELLEFSTAEHIEKINELEQSTDDLLLKLVSFKDGTYLEQMELEAYEARYEQQECLAELIKVRKELEAEKNKGFFARLFG